MKTERFKAWADSWSATPLERISHIVAWILLLAATLTLAWSQSAFRHDEKLLNYYETTGASQNTPK